MFTESEEQALRQLAVQGMDDRDPHVKFHALMLRKRLEDYRRIGFIDARERCIARIRYHEQQMQRTWDSLE